MAKEKEFVMKRVGDIITNKVKFEMSAKEVLLRLGIDLKGVIKQLHVSQRGYGDTIETMEIVAETMLEDRMTQIDYTKPTTEVKKEL
jgi:hypothetical protein